MGSGERRISELGDIEFRGSVGRRVAEYAKQTQQLGHDMARELDTGAEAVRKAIGELEGHPLLLSVDVWLRGLWVSRRLRRARDCAMALSAEAVKFNLEYRKQFLGVDESGRTRRNPGAEI